MNLNFNALLNVLPEAMMGWVNVFIVIAVIVVTVTVLNKVTADKDE